MDYDAKLRELFDRQRSRPSPRLEALIAETERRYRGEALSEEELEMVAAAGSQEPGERDGKKYRKDALPGSALNDFLD